MYESFYHFHGKPFRLTPDAGMLFPTRGHTRAMSYLLYGFSQGEGFVVITGAVGTGKTLLIHKLIADMSDRNIALANIASANLDGQDILPAVASELGVRYERRSKEALLRDVNRKLLELNAANTQALLVVDEAQTLTVKALEMLRILSNLECNGRSLLQVFLVGQSELRNVIAGDHMEQLRQRIIASYQLEALEQDECRDYIMHRLQAVGWKGNPELTPGLFEDVHGASEGIPRKINLIMDRLLLYGYLEEARVLDENDLAVVLDEMRDEMGGVSSTDETPVRAQPTQVEPAPDDTLLTHRLASLELQIKYNNMLLRLIREELRLKKILQPDSDGISVADDVLLAAIKSIDTRSVDK